MEEARELSVDQDKGICVEVTMEVRTMRQGQYLAGLAIIGAVFALFFFFVLADRSGTNSASGPLTEQVRP
jgi:hypothetical protein